MASRMACSAASSKSFYGRSASVWALDGRQEVLQLAARYAEGRRCLVHGEWGHYRLTIGAHTDLPFRGLTHLPPSNLLVASS